MATKIVTPKDVCEVCARNAIVEGEVVFLRLCPSCKKLYYRTAARRNYRRKVRAKAHRANRANKNSLLGIDNDTRAAYDLVIEHLTAQKRELTKRYRVGVSNIDNEIKRLEAMKHS